ncbi:hypothetical protein BDV19DRAFT_392352 [Aspergillus venezuelensis]
MAVIVIPVVPVGSGGTGHGRHPPPDNLGLIFGTIFGVLGLLTLIFIWAMLKRALSTRATNPEQDIVTEQPAPIQAPERALHTEKPTYAGKTFDAESSSTLECPPPAYTAHEKAAAPEQPTTQ